MILNGILLFQGNEIIYFERKTKLFRGNNINYFEGTKYVTNYECHGGGFRIFEKKGMPKSKTNRTLTPREKCNFQSQFARFVALFFFKAPKQSQAPYLFNQKTNKKQTNKQKKLHKYWNKLGNIPFKTKFREKLLQYLCTSKHEPYANSFGNTARACICAYPVKINKGSLQVVLLVRGYFNTHNTLLLWEYICEIAWKETKYCKN